MPSAPELLEVLSREHSLPTGQYEELVRSFSPSLAARAAELAREARRAVYGDEVFIRGLIELSSFCRNDCLYCGLRRSNRSAERYRLTPEVVLACCERGYDLGFRTFVLQGGEDPALTDERVCDLVRAIRAAHPDCAVTLSVGERSFESYRRFARAGADRYLLRHETYDEGHYRKLHPPRMSAAHRKQCLWDLKKLGYQVGTGFMVGAPYQTPENLADDMLFLKELNPQMVGIGPFIPHHDTPFAGKPAGTLELTLFLLGLIRLMLPRVLLPATTALGTIAPDGREQGILAGANVVMPNLSPPQVREKYLLYDNKICTGDEAAESLKSLNARMEAVGYRLTVARGDSLNT